MNMLSRLTDRFLAWHLKPAEAQNFDFLDGLRGLAILFVLMDHLLYVNPSSNAGVRFLGDIFQQGGCGVTLFFCLSGYLVSLPFWKRKRAGKDSVIPNGYGARRFFKIYPPLALSILLLTPFYLWTRDDASAAVYLVPAAEWLAGLSIFIPVDGRFNPVMWSLLVEVQFYLILPVVMLLFRNLSMRRSIWMIPLLFVLIGVCARYMYPAFGIKPTLSPKIYLPFFTGLDLFAMGVLIAGLYAMGLITKSWARIGSIGLLLIFVVLPVGVYTRGEFIESIRKIVFGCTLFLVADAECLAARILCNPLLRWFGIISYEWYLFHQPIFIWFKKTFGPANGSISVYMLIVGGSFMTSLFLAALVYKYFSLPILKYGRSR